MERLTPPQMVHFLKRFRFRGGILRRFKVHNHSLQRTSAELRLVLSEGEKKLRLRMVLDKVEEFRFQRRPGSGLIQLKEVRLGHFNGLFYLNLDAFADDGPLGVHDFRASDCFIAAQDVTWELLAPKAPLPGPG